MEQAAYDDEDVVPWRPFIAGDGGLKVLLPTNPTEQTLTMKTSIGRVEVHGFRSEYDGVVYLATYSECHPRLYLDEYVELLDAPLEHWVPGAKRRKALGERSLPGWGTGGPREDDFALPSRKRGLRWIARRRWLECQGYFYQAIAVTPEAQADSAEVAHYLGSLEAVPIAVDPRGLTRAWKRKTSKDDGFTVLWPERFDDVLIRVVESPRFAAYSTYFIFQRSMGFAVTVVRYGSIQHPGDFPIDTAAAMDDVRDRFLADYHAELVGERPIAHGGRDGREFEAKFTGAAKQVDKSRRHPPGPAVGRVKARLYVSVPRVFLVYVTTQKGQETDKGVETFLDSFHLVVR